MAIEIQVGDIVKTEDFYLLLFPTQKAAARARARTAGAAGWVTAGGAAGWVTAGEAAVAAASAASVAAAAAADYWSRQLNCSVSYIEPTQPMFVVEVCGALIRVLIPGDKSGWIINVDWINLQIVQRFSENDQNHL